MSTTDRVVVVGGGLASVRCLEELRRGDPERELMLLAAEAELPYDRPPLTKTALREGTPPPRLAPNWSELAIETRLATAVRSVDPRAHTVTLADGSELGYGSLVIATGADARALPGLHGPGVHVVRSAQDATGLRADLLEHRRVTIIGAGFIGCEVATTARRLGVEVILLEALAAPLARVLGTTVGAEIARRHRADGVDVRTGAMVTEVRGSGAQRELALSDGSLVPAPVVLVALGARPSIDWLAGSGLDIDHGVLCDAMGRTSAADVFAAGDVAQWHQPATGTQLHHEHWTSAASQGRTVARAVLGAEEPLDEVPYFWSDQLGIMMQMLGTPADGDDVTVVEVPGRQGSLVALYGRGGRLSAAFGISAPRHVMKLRGKIAAGADYREAVAAAGS